MCLKFATPTAEDRDIALAAVKARNEVDSLVQDLAYGKGIAIMNELDTLIERATRAVGGIVGECTRCDVIVLGADDGWVSEDPHGLLCPNCAKWAPPPPPLTQHPLVTPALKDALMAKAQDDVDAERF